MKTKGHSFILSLVAVAMMLISTCMHTRAQDSGRVRSFGPRVGYVSRNASATAGLEFQFAMTRHVRVVPSTAIVFRNRNSEGLLVNLDAQFPFALEHTRLSVYPLAGVGYASWGRHDMVDNKDVTSHANRFTVNAGAGVELMCTQTLKLSLEGRYTYGRNYGTALVSAGIAFVF